MKCEIINSCYFWKTIGHAAILIIAFCVINSEPVSAQEKETLDLKELAEKAAGKKGSPDNCCQKNSINDVFYLA